MNSIAKDYEVRIWYSAEDEGFIAQVIDMPGISAVGETRAEAAREVQTAIELALETYAEEGIHPPKAGSAAATTLGRIGGKVASRRKRAAARRNGLKGGRPPKRATIRR